MNVNKRKQIKSLVKIENWSLRWKVVETEDNTKKANKKTRKLVRRIVGEVINHPEFFNLTEINEEITSFKGREVNIAISRVTLNLGCVDKKFHSLIKENGWKFSYSDPISVIEAQMFE